jgi:XrtJ-associated TM-motif-TM protein
MRRSLVIMAVLSLAAAGGAASYFSGRISLPSVARNSGASSFNVQSGCTDSPENPTVVLALVGGSAALISALRSRRTRSQP